MAGRILTSKKLRCEPLARDDVDHVVRTAPRHGHRDIDRRRDAQARGTWTIQRAASAIAPIARPRGPWGRRPAIWIALGPPSPANQGAAAPRALASSLLHVKFSLEIVLNRLVLLLSSTVLSLSACGADAPSAPDDAAEEAVQAGNSGEFVSVCGTQLCLAGKPFVIHGATAYGEYANPDAEVSLAKHARVNVLEIVEFESSYHELSTAMTEATWGVVDRVIATAEKNGLHVVLNLSSYGQSLQKSGKKPTNEDWSPYLRFVTQRINTQSGRKYADDPTIAMIEVFGEIDPPNGSSPTRGTTRETTEFYRRTLAQARALDPHHVLSAGRFSYLDWNSGIDWKAIMSDPNNQVCGVEINARADRDVSVPAVTRFCRDLGKPWFLAAWSSCFGVEGSNNFGSDAAMAAHAADMYAIAANKNVSGPAPAYAAVGSDFWNLGSVSKAPTCDIGPFFPLTWDVVRQHAP